MPDFVASFGTVLLVHAEYYFNVSVAQAQFGHAQKENSLLPSTKNSQTQRFQKSWQNLPFFGTEEHIWIRSSTDNQGTH